ncbi:MAG: hypothetical protein KF708_00445 [Pirellulales bacterium]|nr:hypothetical protein [Pirellulales bacterium]
MPGVFDRDGLHFQYPENWSVEEDDAAEGARTVSVNSPTGAFWQISIYPRGENPQRLLDTAVAAMREIYDSLETEEVHEQLGGRETTGYDLNFYCLDLTNTAVLRCWQTPIATYLLFYQAEDREYANVEAVFRAITTSLLK